MSKEFLETIKVLDGVAFHLKYHQNRLNIALNSLDTYNLYELIDPPMIGLYKCRILYDENDISIKYVKYTKRSIKSIKLVYNEEIIYGHKYTDRVLINSLFHQRGDSDDILIIKNGLLTDTSVANIALFDGNKWFTPQTPLLKGTCRARLLENSQISERDISVKEIKKFKKIALMNAMIDFDIIASDNIEEIIC